LTERDEEADMRPMPHGAAPPQLKMEGSTEEGFTEED